MNSKDAKLLLNVNLTLLLVTVNKVKSQVENNSVDFVSLANLLLYSERVFYYSYFSDWEKVFSVEYLKTIKADLVGLSKIE